VNPFAANVVEIDLPRPSRGALAQPPTQPAAEKPTDGEEPIGVDGLDVDEQVAHQHVDGPDEVDLLAAARTAPASRDGLADEAEVLFSLIQLGHGPSC
jgi:hypothetical protein